MAQTAVGMGHVNMMADTVIVNASPEDLRAILRNMLSSKIPGLAAAFVSSTQARLTQCQPRCAALDLTPPQRFFDPQTGMPTLQFHARLQRARLLFGSGLGFASLTPLTAVVRSTIGCQWNEEGVSADALAMADADIAQAIQSCKDEMQGSGVERVAVDYASARAAVEELRSSLMASREDVELWGGEFPFERALYSVLDLKL